MTNAPAEDQVLRQLAEEKLRALKSAPPETTSSADATRILHELRVHQIELEMQNEELRRTQDELERSRGRYFDLYDLAPVGYLTLSERGLIQEVNLAAATMFGVNRGGLVQQPISRFIHKEDQDAYYRHRRAFLEAGEPQACELRMVKDAGTVFWARLETRAKQATGTNSEKAPDGQLLIYLTLSDINELKLAEEEKIKAEVQLSQALKMESVGRLAGGVAHDFNNMLSVIIGHANLALMDVDPSQQMYIHLEEIRKAADRSADLTRQLLAFARKQTIEAKVLNLNEVVGGLLSMLGRMIGENIKLRWQPGASLFPVKVDPAQVNQILVNLCTNARDSISGVGEITIATRNSVVGEAYCAHHNGLSPGEYVQITVSDNGCGMDQDTLTHIFEPFFTTKELGKGTGLGLATVFGSVKQNNGFINVQSCLGSGTTFTIYLPRQRAISAQTQPDPPGESPEHGQETILLVEDEPSVLKMAAMMLAKQGYTVLAVNSPREAIETAREHTGEISLLLTDVVMPEMNGWELSKSLLSHNPRLRCLFMSGYTADIIAHHGEVDGSVHFIQKPYSMTDLAAKVRLVLDATNERRVY